MKSVVLFSIAIIILFTHCNNMKASNSDSIPAWQLVSNWPQLPADYKLGNPTGIGIDSNQHIFVFHRANRDWSIFSSMPSTPITQNTVLELDNTTGKIINSWGANLFVMPHGLKIDDDNNIWLTDVGLHQVFKFTHNGKLLMKLGEAGIAGNDSAHFNRPTDVAVAKDGSFYVSDGYGNSRIMKFSATGKYLLEWGSKGNKPGEFNIPHGITLDNNGNVYVADRQNNRIQVFDSNGNFLNQWKQNDFANMYAVTFDAKNNRIIGADYLIKFELFSKGSNIIVFDTTGNIHAKFGRGGLYNGPVCRYHDIAIDKEGCIYVGDIKNNSIQKFVPQK